MFRNLIFIGFLALAAFALVGFFMDWYSIGGVETPAGRHSFQVDIDSAKIKADLTRGKEKLSDTVDSVKNGGEGEHVQPARAEKPTFSVPRF